MVLSDTCLGERDALITVKPNPGLTCWQNRLLLLVFAVWLFGIAAYFSTLGAWLVVPFAGAEFLLIFLGFCWQRKAAQRVQKVRVSPQTVSVADTAVKDCKQIEFQTHWARLKRVPGIAHWHSSRLFIGSHGRYVEVGSFVTDEERDRLDVLLAGCLSQINTITKPPCRTVAGV